MSAPKKKTSSPFLKKAEGAKPPTRREMKRGLGRGLNALIAPDRDGAPRSGEKEKPRQACRGFPNTFSPCRDQKRRTEVIIPYSAASKPANAFLSNMKDSLAFFRIFSDQSYI